SPIIITDPQTGTPFPNNVISSNRISPAAQNILSDAIPLPNVGQGEVAGTVNVAPSLFNNFFLRGKALPEGSNIDLRIDHYFKPTQHLYGHFTYFHNPSAADQTFLPGFGGNVFIEQGRNLTVHYVSSLTPALLNHVMFGYFRNHTPEGPEGPGFVPPQPI